MVSEFCSDIGYMDLQLGGFGVHTPLNHINSKIPLVIMYVDLVGSTKMNTFLDIPEDSLGGYDLYIRTRTKHDYI
jgi:hypothetical protein